MERRLLLLGLLRGEEMHGYRLTEMLDSKIPRGIKLKKSNAYQLLKKMKQDGLVTDHTEQEGNRPPRQVYSITEKGEAAFQQFLRESLVANVQAELPAAVPLNFLSNLPKREAVRLLKQRREKIAQHVQELKGIEHYLHESHCGFDYLYKHSLFELRWLDKTIKKLSSGTKRGKK